MEYRKLGSSTLEVSVVGAKDAGQARQNALAGEFALSSEELETIDGAARALTLA